ncbi:sensor histidine kinase [Sulfurimonas sp.]|uniref:sensor histidine kinase n=1 Tax=Sulfurimonas sp. TaxID=2022749 RepID=UPI003D0E6035
MSKKNDNSIDEQVKGSVFEIMENIAHQWRQPLAQINATVTTIDNILFEQKIDNPRLEEKLLEIERLTKYMSETIEDFTQNFDNQELKAETKLGPLLQSAIEVVRDSFEKNNIEIVQNFHDDYKCKCLAKKLKQIVVVLLNNAKDALLIRNTFNAKVCISLDQVDTRYIISISDNGGGISKSVQQKMFEPYYTTKHTSEGTGIGLYMAKKIIQEEYKGSLDVKNVDDGTRFTIYLPK